MKRNSKNNALYAGIKSFVKGEDRGITLTFLSFDEEKNLSDEECKKAIVFATILCGGFEDEYQIYEEYIKKGRMEKKAEWNETINDVDCRIRFQELNVEDSYSHTLLISFYTDKQVFLEQ